MAVGKLPVIFLMGPTAVGKTALAVTLAQNAPVELVSVDSAMVYRGMDIGTGKPPRRVLDLAPHRLIDVSDPDKPYCAAKFCREASEAIAQIHRRNKIPLLVGGTGLYFRSLRDGLSALPRGDSGLRQRLAEEAVTRGWPHLHQRLAQVDPISARHIHPNDPQRIQRALEVYELTGEPMSRLQRNRRGGLTCPVHQWVLMPPDRRGLHHAIEQRFCQMLEQGLVAELKGLLDRFNLNADLPSMRAVGYRQVWRYVHGEWDLATMTAKAIAATRQLARRQMTWFRAETADLVLQGEPRALLDRAARQLHQVLQTAGQAAF